MSRHDPHSYADDTQPSVTHLDWQVSVDMGSRTLAATATLTLDRRNSNESVVDLDTRDLALHRISDATTTHDLSYELGAVDDVLGQRLRVQLGPDTTTITISYSTAPEASALQWLSPEQTADGHPFVYSQCQTIHARSMVPVPDSPACRMSVTAAVDVASEYVAVMAATSAGPPEPRGNGQTTYRFRTEQTIPAYLLAFAVGVLESREIGPRSVVWAEPSVVEAAAWEFAEVEDLLQAGEAILGPLPWERADLLVLPPSYPYGGMENPQLIYLTPTLITGDRSLVNVLAHEIVHQWTGNMVTCASLEHFWINEGFTIFGERKIVEAREGLETAELQTAIGRGLLDNDLRYLASTPELTCLRLHLDGLNPDVSSSWVALEKGYLFLRAIEESVGTSRFSAFLRDYLAAFAFRSVTGEEFVAYARAQLGEAVDYDTWLLAPGLPADTPAAASSLLERIRAIGTALPDPDFAATWDAAQWQAYLTSLSAPVPLELLTALDATYGLTHSPNHDTQGLWLLLALRSGYSPAVDATVDFVSRFGRLKHLKNLYDALADSPDTTALATETFARNRTSYHPIAVSVIGARLAP